MKIITTIHLNLKKIQLTFSRFLAFITNKKRYTRKNIIISLVILISALILGLSLRGHLGNPTATELNNNYWKDNGPLELSPERGRFALLYSLAEDHSFFFSLPLARFATPDLGYENGHYVSLFAPAVSFFAIPGYLIGKALGASQAGSVSVICLSLS
jgi:hypothetical protein